jgi:hypothetical protein
MLRSEAGGWEDVMVVDLVQWVFNATYKKRKTGVLETIAIMRYMLGSWWRVINEWRSDSGYAQPITCTRSLARLRATEVVRSFFTISIHSPSLSVLCQY